MAELPGLIYAQQGADHVYVNLFIASDADVIVNGVPVKLSQQTNYPWDGRMTIPVAVLLFGFLLFIAYPAVQQITTLSAPGK